MHRYLSTQNEVSTPSALQKAAGRDLVLSPPALVVTREYEWANIIIGFEQANRYTIRAAPGGEVVGFLAEVRHSTSKYYSKPCLSLWDLFLLSASDTIKIPVI